MRDNFFKGLAIRLGVRGLIAIGVPLAVLVMYLMLYMLQGRKPEGLPSVYGKRSGSGATGSVNGTRVFAEMFVKQGHKVRTLSRLSPGINDRADVIVWIPDSFEPPDKEQREFLEGLPAYKVGMEEPQPTAPAPRGNLIVVPGGKH